MPRTIQRSARSAPDPSAIKTWVREFAGLGDQIKALTKRKDDIKKRLSESVEDSGEEDDKGHVWLELDEEVAGIGALKRERRVGQTLDPDKAQALLEAKGLGDRCYKLVPVLDEDEVMAAHYEGLLTEAEIDSMFPKKVTFAFVPVKAR